MKKKKEEDKKKNLTFSIDPRIHDMWIRYCEENEIENYSEYIEMMIQKRIEKDKVNNFIFYFKGDVCVDNCIEKLNKIFNY